MHRKDSRQNKIKAIFLLLVFLAVTGSVFGSPGAIPLFTDAQIQQAIIQTLGESDFHPDSDHKIHYLARAADLNGDK